MQVMIPRNIYLAPNIRIKALNNVGFRFAKFALFNSDVHVLKCAKQIPIYFKVFIRNTTVL